MLARSNIPVPSHTSTASSAVPIACQALRPGGSVAMRMARTATASSARRSTLMARSGAMIEERSALHGEEFPGVTAVEQRQLEQPVRVAVPLFAVRRDGAEEVMAIAPS